MVLTKAAALEPDGSPPSFLEPVKSPKEYMEHCFHELELG